jgi:hypothetical protein
MDRAIVAKPERSHGEVFMRIAVSDLMKCQILR